MFSAYPGQPVPRDGFESGERRLSSLVFSDLMLWPDGQAFLRHVPGHEGPVIPISADYEADLNEVRARLAAKQDEREFFFEHDDIPYRVARIETIRGHGYFLRRPKFPVPTLGALGMSPAMVQTLRALGRSRGMILVAGATGSGKSTSVYSMLSEYVATQGDIVVGVEDPPEIPVQGVYGERGQGLWYQIDAKKAGGYEVAMVSAMRYNPRYIMVGEIRSPIVANEAVRAAVNGHLVLATIHGNSIVGAVLALQQLAAAAHDSLDLARSILADGLVAVLHQSLHPVPGRPGERSLQVESLCMGEEHGIRAKIRSGKLEQLSTEIEQQRLRMERGQLPTTL